MLAPGMVPGLPSAGRLGSGQELDLLPPGCQGRLRVEHRVQLVELLAQRGCA
jgi:hypothetical protein